MFSADGKDTYSFDTDTHEWTRHGECMLPFEGQACYDDEVDDWTRGWGSTEMPRRLGAYAPATSCPSTWKLTKEKMAYEGRTRHTDVTLAHMGGGKFCLVEWRSPKGVPEDVLEERCLLYTVAFCFLYDKDRGLQATARRTCSYAVGKKSDDFDWCAFGI